MAAVDPDLILHWVMDRMTDGAVPDVSGGVHLGRLRGHPTLIADATFGRCLRFAGGGDGLSIHPFVDFPESALTVAFWVRSSAQGTRASLLSYANHEHDNAFALTNHRDLNVYVGKKYERDTGVGSADGTWHHVAITWQSSDGEIKVYRDGAVAHADTLAPGARIAGGGSLMLAQDQDEVGGKIDPAQAFTGDLSNFRVYRRVLAANEIETVMAADVARVDPTFRQDRDATIAFVRTHPILFELADERDRGVIYIDRKKRRNVELRVRNVGSAPLRFRQPAAGDYNLELEFRSGTLTKLTVDREELERGGWDVEPKQAADRGFSLALSTKVGRTLEPYQTLTISLGSTFASGFAESGEITVLMNYRGLLLPDRKELTGHVSRELEIVDRRGSASVPLRVAFVGGNVTLNRGESLPVTLALEIANPSTTAAVEFQGEREGAPSQLVLSADVQPPEERREWALGTTSEIRAIEPELSDVRWRMVESDLGEAPEWIFTPTETMRLGPGERLRLLLRQVSSSLPSGSANFYLRYERIPGYRDGLIVLAVTKGPIIVRDVRSESGVSTGGSHVGINTATPRSGLDTGPELLSGTAHDYYRAQQTMSGGGTVTWGGPGGRLSWSRPFRVTSVAGSPTFSDGYVSFGMPASIPADAVPDGQARASGAGIVLRAQEALFAAHRVGGGANDISGYHIVNRNNRYTPGNWFLIAVVNDDDGTLKLGTGVVLSARSSSSHGSSVPSGTILMWSGQIDAIPDGWALCDGNNGTPNLMDRFVVGAGRGYQVANQGGADNVVLTDAQMPAHAHGAGSAPGGGHAHWIEGTDANGLARRRRRYPGTTTVDLGFGGGRDSDPNDERWRGMVNTQDQPPHTHAISVYASGGSQPHENRPPFYALAYIMKL